MLSPLSLWVSNQGAPSAEEVREVPSSMRRIYSLAINFFNPVFTASSTDDPSSSRWAAIKNQCICCLTVAYSCIQRVARAFYRFMHSVLFAEDAKQRAFEAVCQNGLELGSQNTVHRTDRQVVYRAVRQNGLALRYTSTELQADRFLVLKAVRQNGNALEYAAPFLRQDIEVVVAAVRQDGMALQYAHPSLQRYREVIAEALTQNADAQRYVSVEFVIRNREFINEVLRQAPNDIPM